MRRIQAWTQQQIIDYNLRDGGTAVTIFADAQTGRVEKAREIISTILEGAEDALIVEPGCSSGDIAGWFTPDHRAIGYDVVPAAVAATRARWPWMDVTQATAEEIEPFPCDVLVLCEFLEHIDDPDDFVKKWLPMAKNVVIGHPLVMDGHDPEQGHVWAYYPEDFEAWFPMGGHVMQEAWTFPMGPYLMIIGWGKQA